MRTSAVLTVYAGLAIAASVPGPTAAQSGPRQAPPSGREIGDKAKTIKLDRENATTADFHGKKITLTPADLSTVKSMQELEAGQVVGLLETEAAGDETGLPPGKYDIFFAKVGDKWHAYAESNGEVVAEGARVSVQKLDKEPASKKPQFQEKGWCYLMVWWWFGWHSTQVCF